MIKPAELGWRDGQPYSKTYQDIYHAADGPGEVERVFIHPGGLLDHTRKRDRVYVGELGFGTGLNFAMTAQACLDAGCRLHFISFEAAPITPEEFTKLANERRADQPIYAEMASDYPPLIDGWHRRYFANGKVTLSVYWGDAADGLADLVERQRRPVDLWYLDGFDPRKNPALWQPEMFGQLASLSARHTTIATFTSAGHVRRGLQDAGFNMRRIDQRPHKRESLAGTFAGASHLKADGPAKVSVIGAGLAGASIARHLAESGVQVSVHHAPSIQATSAIPTMVLHARLLGDESIAAELRCHAYLYASAYCRDLPGVLRSGALQLPGPNMTPAKLEIVASRYAASGDWIKPLTAIDATQLANWPVHDAALSFQNSSIIDTPRLCAHLLDHPHIELRESEPLCEPPAYPCVLACGQESRTFAAASYLEIAAVSGQLDFVTMEQAPSMPIIGDGYLAPHGNQLAVGATYEYHPWLEEQATETNLARLSPHDYRWQSRSRGIRCVSSDRIPVAGPLYDSDEVAVPGFYVSVGHGSMGTVTSHYAAALLTAQITGECPPMSRKIEALMSPMRFRERQARRGYRQGATD